MQGFDNRPPSDQGARPAGAEPRRQAMWPVPPASLSALVDLGMSDEGIGRYYAVGTQAITALRSQYAAKRETP